MSKFVVYVSKSGNTEAIAKKIAEIANCELIPLKAMGKKEDKSQEESRFKTALKKCKGADLVFVGTPVIAKQPHNKIAKFVNTVEAKRIAFFITYENNMGFTLKEMKDSAEIRSIRVLGEIEFKDLKSDAIKAMGESDKQKILEKSEKFAKDCLQAII